MTTDVRLPERCCLHPGLLFTNLGVKHSERDDNYSFKETVSLHYFPSPIEASLRVGLSYKVQWHIHAGPYLGLGPGGKIKYEETYQGNTETYQIKAFGMTPEDAGNENDARGGLHRFNMGLTFGTGFSFGHVYVGVNMTWV